MRLKQAPDFAPRAEQTAWARSAPGLRWRCTSILRRYLPLWPPLLLLAGCGRPATEADCTEILRRAARLELESRLDQSEGLVQAEISQLEETMRPQMMKQCVGKRITDKAMACVKSARSSEELFDRCLR